jgi:hypothetical protein
MPGQSNICLHDYYYSLRKNNVDRGKLRGKIVHFRTSIGLSQEEASIFY